MKRRDQSQMLYIVIGYKDRGVEVVDILQYLLLRKCGLIKLHLICERHVTISA